MSGGDEPNSLPKEMSIEELNPIVRKLCVGTKGYPETGGDGPIIKDVTNEIAWNVRAAIFTPQPRLEIHHQSTSSPPPPPGRHVPSPHRPRPRPRPRDVASPPSCEATSATATRPTALSPHPTTAGPRRRPAARALATALAERVAHAQRLRLSIHP